MSAPVQEIRGVILPAGAAGLLLPNAAVAEVLGYRDPTPVPDSPPWLLGMVPWRERLLPLVSLPDASRPPQPGTRGPRARLAVCYSPDGHPALPYIGIVAVGPPRLARFRAENLDPVGAADPNNPFVLHALTYADQPAWIPDLDALKRALLEILSAAGTAGSLRSG